MSFAEHIAQQPQWVQIWLNWMLFAVFILPFSLFIWRETRKTALIAIGVSILSGAGIQLMFAQFGYVRLLGLAHIIFWVPLMFYLKGQYARAELPRPARFILIVIMTTILISLVFDFVDVGRYILGERAPF